MTKLSAMPPARRAHLMDDLRKAGIALVTLPATDFF